MSGAVFRTKILAVLYDSQILARLRNSSPSSPSPIEIRPGTTTERTSPNTWPATSRRRNMCIRAENGRSLTPRPTKRRFCRRMSGVAPARAAASVESTSVEAPVSTCRSSLAPSIRTGTETWHDGATSSAVPAASPGQSGLISVQPVTRHKPSLRPGMSRSTSKRDRMSAPSRPPTAEPSAIR